MQAGKQTRTLQGEKAAILHWELPLLCYTASCQCLLVKSSSEENFALSDILVLSHNNAKYLWFVSKTKREQIIWFILQIAGDIQYNIWLPSTTASQFSARKSPPVSIPFKELRIFLYAFKMLTEKCINYNGSFVA